MASFFHPDPEAAALRAELVAALFTVLLPSTIMACTFAAVGMYTGVTIGGAWLWAAVTAGIAASVCKLVLILAYRQNAPRHDDAAAVARCERRYAGASWLFSAAVAATAASTFMTDETVPQMLSTGMLFGYGSGLVARGSVRPRICFVSLMLAVPPVAAVAIWHGGAGYWMLAVMFLVFMTGSLESVRHVYRTAVQQIRLRDEMGEVARQDVLTGLANRFGLREAFAALLPVHRGAIVAMHCLDLDRFKPINDSHGHPAGDDVLCQVAARITATLRPGDIAARLGGDEFAVVQTGIRHPDEAELYARRLARAITLPYSIGSHVVELGVSMGYATSPPDPPRLADLLAKADMALYRAKHGGGGLAPAQAGEVAR